MVINNKKKHTFMFLINKYPKSIANKYYNSVKKLPEDKKWNNIKIISEIVDEISSEKPSSEIIVIHLRLGDAILNYKNDKFIFRGNSSGVKYGTPIYKLEQFFKKNKKKKILLVYGIHNGAGYNIKYSNIYLNKLRKILKENNIVFSERHNNNPDLDFSFMCKSSHFVKSGGGFSNLIASVVEYRGNKVYKL